MINITPKTIQIAENAEMHIEKDTHIRTYPNGKEIELDSVSICDENSDFLIEYVYDVNGDLFLACKPDYVEDLPYHLCTSLMLRKVMEFVAKEYGNTGL